MASVQQEKARITKMTYGAHVAPNITYSWHIQLASTCLMRQLQILSTGSVTLSVFSGDTVLLEAAVYKNQVWMADLNMWMANDLHIAARNHENETIQVQFCLIKEDQINPFREFEKVFHSDLEEEITNE